MSNPLEVAYQLSASGRREVAERFSMGYRRQGGRTCAGDQLAVALGELGLPVTKELLDFENNMGGWCDTNSQSLWGFGVNLSLDDAPNCHAIATRFRRRTAWFANDEDRRNGPVEWSYLPLRGSGYPRAFFRDRALIPMGMAGEEHVYFLGSRGEVYLFLTSQEQLFLVAGSGRTLIERWGMSRNRGDQHFAEVHICADVATLTAGTLGVPLFEPACDDYFTVWANDTVQLRLVHDVAPNVFGTHIAAREPEQLILAVRSMMACYKWQSVRTWAGANNVDDLGGRAILQNAGIDLDVLFGPGPGNFEYTIDPDTGEGAYTPSAYDSSDWK